MKSVYSLILFSLLFACDDSSVVKLTDDKGDTVEVSSREDNGRSEVTMTGKDGQTITMTSDTKNAKFPAFAPQYPGSNVVSNSTFNTGKSGMMTIEMSSSASADDVIAFYKASAAKSGLPIGMTGNFEGTGSLQAGDSSKENAPTLMVTAAPENGATKISLLITNAQ